MILWHVGMTLVLVWLVVRDNPKVDYRVVAFASMLPDLVDKPLGRLLFRDELMSGRVFGHTLLFHVVLFCGVMLLNRPLRTRFVVVPFASLLHVFQDGVMWNLGAFLWPFYGTSFERHYRPGTWQFNPLQNPDLLREEIVGLVLLVGFFAANGMLNARGIRRFLRTGNVTAPERELVRLPAGDG